MSTERIEQLKAILITDPNNTLARYALGMEFSGRGDTEAAVAEFQFLLQANPEYPNAYFMAAQALERAGRVDEAIEWLKNGIACASRTGNRHAQGEMQAMLDDLDR